MKHVLHPEADEELANAARYYAAIDPELGRSFYNEMDRLIREICADPKRFRRFEGIARRHISRRFPYAVLHVDTSECVWIVAIMHMKRRPGYWERRTA